MQSKKEVILKYLYNLEKYYSKRDINFTSLYKDEGSGYRIECSTDNQGSKRCFPVPEEIDFNPDVYIVPGPNG